MQCAAACSLISALSAKWVREEPVGTSGSFLELLKGFARRVWARDENRVVGACPVCTLPLSDSQSKYESVTHNPETCRLLNLVLAELGVRIPGMVRVNVYPGAGPLRGFYFTADPYAINISEEAYAEMREYIIFHETKHLVDCLQFGQSDEVTPDRFARSLCAKYGYRCPSENPVSPSFAYA